MWMLLLGCGSLGHATPPSLQVGDLVFHRSRSAQARFISLATHSPWTHVGVVMQERGAWVVLEAGDPVSTVPLTTWARRSADGRIGIRRLQDAEDRWTPEAVARLITQAEVYRGRRYDAAFAWSDDRLYCSELAFKLISHAVSAPVATVRRFEDFDVSHPDVRAAVRARWTTLPRDEPVIAPSDLYADPQWRTVCEGAVSACVP